MPLPPAAAEARQWGGGGYACRHCVHTEAGPVTRPLFAFHTWKSKLKGTVTPELHPAAWAEGQGGGLPALSPWSSLNWSVWVTAHSMDLAWGVDSLPASSRWSRRTATQLGPSLSPHGPQRRPMSHQSCRTGPGVPTCPGPSGARSSSIRTRVRGEAACTLPCAREGGSHLRGGGAPPAAAPHEEN